MWDSRFESSRIEMPEILRLAEKPESFRTLMTTQSARQLDQIVF